MQKKEHFSTFHKLFLPPSFQPGVTISTGRLGILALVSLILLLLSRLMTSTYPHPRQQDMQKAARHMEQAMGVIKEYHQQIYLLDKQLDPLQSGFIGVEFSPITTTLGDLNAKINSTNPDFAALFVYWFYELSLSAGNKIVIQTSGSFPALSIACIIAAETYGLQPVIFSSAGASSFGANMPRFTYWDMENILYSKGIIGHRSKINTPGGQNDNGSSLWEGGMEIVRQAAERNGYALIIPENLDKAIEMKLKEIK
ncbi:MAG TPA: poly-gamma-glutamate system protein, partial [Calditrichaeota bacterium]|nr:poly-gamma-glutamate system protein [Calditrichota bacterium]